MKKTNLFFIIAACTSLMCGCENEIPNTATENSINIVSSVSSELIVRNPSLDENGKGNFSNGDVFSLIISNPEKEYILNDFIVGKSDLKWKEVNISSSNGKVDFSACYPMQNITNGKFTFDMSTATEKDLLLAQTKGITLNSKEPVYLNFEHAMHKLVISYSTDKDMNITTECTALSTCEIDVIENSLSIKGNSKHTSMQAGKEISFLLVPQNTSDITLNISYGEKSKSYKLNELITDYNMLERGKRYTLYLNIKNGDINIEDSTIGSWGDQGSANDNIIM